MITLKSNWFMTLASLLLAVVTFNSCGPETVAEEISVSLRKSQGNYEAGYVFISVFATGDWTLEIQYDGETSWAKLSKTSGTGASNSVSLSYDENQDAEPRSLTVVLTSNGVTAFDSFTQSANPGSSQGGWL